MERKKRKFKKKSLVIEEHDWQKEWQGMPEFVQENKEAIKRVAINFETAEDMALFNKITGLNITMKTKGVFFPLPEKRAKKVYVDES